jgi:hypothetical protein
VSKKPGATTRAEAIQLRKWCVEQAMVWPVESPFGQRVCIEPTGKTSRARDIDVIERAEKLYAYVMNVRKGET